MSDDYTPSDGEVLTAVIIYRAMSTADAPPPDIKAIATQEETARYLGEYRRWLAAHDAAKRVEWDAERRGEQGERLTVAELTLRPVEEAVDTDEFYSGVGPDDEPTEDSYRTEQTQIRGRTSLEAAIWGALEPRLEDVIDLDLNVPAESALFSAMVCQVADAVRDVVLNGDDIQNESRQLSDRFGQRTRERSEPSDLAEDYFETLRKINPSSKMARIIERTRRDLG